MKGKVILLASGGLDSTTVAYWLQKRGVEVTPVFFDYGQHCVETEWKTLRDVLPIKFIESTVRISLREIFSGSCSRLLVEADLWNESVGDEELYIPYRTLIFFSVAAVRAQILGVTEVYSGFINSNYVKELDCSTDFFNRLDALSETVGPVRFKIPFRDMTKGEVAKLAGDLGVPIGKTFSCQVWSDFPCGACPNCVERLSAMDELRTL